MANWIKKAISSPGALHKELHVPIGQKIPAKKLEKASHSSNSTEKKRAILAKTLSKFHHGKGGPSSFKSLNQVNSYPNTSHGAYLKTQDAITRKTGDSYPIAPNPISFKNPGIPNQGQGMSGLGMQKIMKSKIPNLNKL